MIRDGASRIAETELGSLEACLCAVHQRIAARFVRAEPRQRAFAYLRGLLGPAHRKNGWQLAAQAGEATPDGMQRLLASAQWDADQVRDDARDFIVEKFGNRQGMLVAAEHEFLKKGNRSVGVGQQYSRTTGHIENCQVGTFLIYATQRSHVIIDRDLYLPRPWTEDIAARRRAGVPDNVTFRTKSQLTIAMVDRTLAAGVPVRWFGAGEPYGSDRSLRTYLAQRVLPHVLGIGPDERLPIVHAGRAVQYRAASVLSMVPSGSWTEVVEGADHGRRGSVYCWARLPMPPHRLAPAIARWLLLRRSLVGFRGLRFYVCGADRATTLGELIEVARAVDSAPRCLVSACMEAGLATYEVRRWTGWYRHITLACLAHVSLVAARAAPDGKPRLAASARPRPYLSVPPRRSGAA